MSEHGTPNPSNTVVSITTAPSCDPLRSLLVDGAAMPKKHPRDRDPGYQRLIDRQPTTYWFCPVCRWSKERMPMIIGAKCPSCGGWMKFVRTPAELDERMSGRVK